MKTENSKLMVLLAAMSLMAVGCGSEQSLNANSPLAVYTPIAGTAQGAIPLASTGPGAAQVAATPSTVDFVPTSLEEFNSFVALHPLNAPTNFKLTVNLKDAGNGRYAGKVKISYVDTGYLYQPTFEAGSGTNQNLSGLRDSGLMEAEFNRWFILDGKYYFSAYFQDAYGAIVLVFDSYVNQGDAQGAGFISGSVYYKNFAQSYRTGGEATTYRKCWYIYQGPYTCRDAAVMDKSAVYPGDGYRKLGTFSGLSMAEAMK